MDYTMDDNDVDMPYAPPLAQAAASRCPTQPASQNGMHTANTRYPPLMNPWTGYNMTPSVYGAPNMPPIPYGGPTPSYTATQGLMPGYNDQYTHWSQSPRPRVQSNAYPNFQGPQHQNLEPSSSRPSLPPPITPDYPWSGVWPTPHNPLDMSPFAEETPVADNNNFQRVDYMGNGRARLSREQDVRRLEQERRARNTPQEANMEASMQPPLSNASSNAPVPANNPEWDRPSARQARRLAEVNRRADALDRARRDLDTDEEDFGHSDDDENSDGMISYSEYLQMVEENTLITALRGRFGGADMGNKRMPSKEFMHSLESLNPDDLSKEERSVSELPLRIPKCRHVFGAICIKKWFKENDSCPYCRDKVPSESAKKAFMRQYRQALHSHMRGEMRRRQLTGRPAEAGSLYPGALNPEEYHDMSLGDRTLPSWTRPSTTDAAESRRRLLRGRTGSHREAHRPSSMGSARFYSPTSQLQNEVSPAQTHTRQSSNSEGVSPAIAVGSTTTNGDRQPAPLSVNSSGNFADSNSYLSRTNSATLNSFMSPSAPSYSQNRPIAFGSMRASTFDATRHETPAHFYNFQPQVSQPQVPQQEDSVSLQRQQLAMQQQDEQFQQQLREQRQRGMQREIDMEQHANGQQFLPDERT
ncbi:hypothetical protein NHQ30_001234 [Ciborinia camelliae]|nr:hypothetical protein NHQ30_001234 [Ciborinia camelliae]